MRRPFEAHDVAEADTDVVVTESPGIYPKFPKASYVLARRAGEDLSTTFAAVIEPVVASRIIKEVDSLTPPLKDATDTVAMKIKLMDGKVDYVAQGMIEGEITSDAGLGIVRTRPVGTGNEWYEGTLIGGKTLSGRGLILKLPAANFEDRIEKVDLEKCVLYTPLKFPEKNFAGQMITINSPQYSRNSAYRISKITREGELSAIHLLPTTFNLGKGHLEKDPPNDHILPNIVPLEYAKAVRGKQTDFFRGKIIKNKSASTRIKSVTADGMSIEVESSKGFRAGDDLMIEDIQAGDRFTIACFVHVQRADDGKPKVISNTDAVVVQE